jgi:hypothetical protein
VFLVPIVPARSLPLMTRKSNERHDRIIAIQDESDRGERARKKSVNQWLAYRKKMASRIDPKTAEIYHKYCQILDPYGVWQDMPREFYQVGKEYFARAAGTRIWIWFGDLPHRTEKALRRRIKSG